MHICYNSRDTTLALATVPPAELVEYGVEGGRK